MPVPSQILYVESVVSHYTEEEFRKRFWMNRTTFNALLVLRAYGPENVWRKNIFDIYITEYGTALTTILPILFLYLNTVTVTAGTFEP
jgi:hypothetical protein